MRATHAHTASPAPDVRRRDLTHTPALRARLLHYRAGLHQPTHEHADTQISFLLLGELREVIARREAMPLQASVGVKFAGTSHAAQFGPGGALMLSLQPGDAQDLAALRALQPCTWHPTAAPAQRLLRALLHPTATACTDPMQDLLHDLLAALIVRAAPARIAPLWLRRVRERLRDAPHEADIAALAREADVHRVYLSRRFQEQFGLPPSVYRSRCMAARAMSAVLDTAQGLAHISAEHGFSDQSHLTRVLRQHAGVGPSQLRRVFA